MTAFHLRVLLHRCMQLEIGLDALDKLHPDLLVGHFATTETQRHLGLVSLLQETYQVAQFDLVIPFLRPWPDKFLLAGSLGT